MSQTNDATDNLYKVLGAVALTGQNGAVDRIDPTILRQGDACFCIASTGYYIFRAYESSAIPTTKPFTENNPPLIIQPDTELFGNATTFRWHLISSTAFVSDIKMSVGTKIIVDKIQGQPNISFYDGTGNKVAEVKSDGTFWVSKLLTGSTELVKNLNAELFGGRTENEFILRDGSRPFTNPVAGPNPTLPDHFATKNYVDEKVQILEPELYVRRDGTAGFEAPVSGFDPTLPDHLATKRYVDNSLDSTINKLFELQRFIIYKTGTATIPVNTRRLTVNFGGNLSRYTVFATVVNVADNSPVSTTAVISEQYTNYFTADFGGEVPSASYKLNWLIVGIPEGFEEFETGTADTEENPDIPVISSNTRNKVILQEDTNIYVSGTTGNDSNDGYTRKTAKKTVAGLLTLLNSIDPEIYKVKVIIDNPLLDVESLWFLPGYSTENLQIVSGTGKNDLDIPGNVIFASGGCKFYNLKIKSITVLANASLEFEKITLKPTNSFAPIVNYGNLLITGSNYITEKSSTFVRNYNKVIFDNVTLNGGEFGSFVEVNSGSVIFNNFACENSKATFTASLSNGGMVSGITKDFPGSGQIKSSNSAYSAISPVDWKHALQHSKDGIDPITPESIGALNESGNAKTADKWNKSINLKLLGSVTGQANIDGSTDVEISTVLNTSDPTLSGISEHITKSNVHNATTEPSANKLVIRDKNGTTEFSEAKSAKNPVILQQFKEFSEEVKKHEEVILNSIPQVVNGVANGSVWNVIGNMLFCWGNVKFFKGKALVELPREFDSVNYNVTFTATNLEEITENITFVLNNKETNKFTASCYPYQEQEQHAYMAVGILNAVL